MASFEHPFVDTLTDLLCREGSAFENDDREIHRARIAAELASGQWVMVTDDKTDRLLGWLAWYRVDDETFNFLKEHGMEEWVRTARPCRIDQGPNLFIADAIVAPWAPRWVYSGLRNLAIAQNSDAVRGGAWLFKRSGDCVFHERGLNNGVRKREEQKLANQ